MNAPTGTLDSAPADAPVDASPTEDTRATFAGVLRASVVELATVREEVAQRTAAIKAKRDAFEATIMEDVARLAASQRALAAADSNVRAHALVVHELTKDKKPAPGVEIIGSKEYEVDQVAGLAWAIEKGMCLVPQSLDLKKVQKLATVEELPFVKVTEVPSVRIASDLFAAMQKAEQP